MTSERQNCQTVCRKVTKGPASPFSGDSIKRAEWLGASEWVKHEHVVKRRYLSETLGVHSEPVVLQPHVKPPKPHNSIHVLTLLSRALWTRPRPHTPGSGGPRLFLVSVSRQRVRMRRRSGASGSVRCSFSQLYRSVLLFFTGRLVFSP